MTAPGAKVGPLTPADLQAIWESAVDSSYSQPLEAAGEGSGFEAYTQMFQQFERASQAVDTTFQAMYIFPGSGQSGPPAAGEQKATVTLTFQRDPKSAYISQPLVLVAGTFVDEQTTDWGPNPGDPGVTVLTGRRYALSQTLAFAPGDSGPYTVQAVAEKAGYGYNNPLPGTLRVVDQPGTQYTNVQGTVALAPGNSNLAATLTARNVPDMFLPQHVGQYVLFTSGANAGNVTRVIGFLSPQPSANLGSSAILAYDQAVEVTVTSGTFQDGEPIAQTFAGSVVGHGTVLATAPAPGGGTRLTYTLLGGFFVTNGGNVITGTNSAATATVLRILTEQTFTAENPISMAGAAWRVLDWAIDLKVSVTNTQSPSGGLSGMLDLILYGDRNIPRGPSESDTAYRNRGGALADTVSPNAIRRAFTRSLSGAGWCFREVSYPLLPGMYFDVLPPIGVGDFFDTHCLLFGVEPSAGWILGEPMQWQEADGTIIAKGYFVGACVGDRAYTVVSQHGSPMELALWKTSVSTGDVLKGMTSGFVLGASKLVIPTCRVSLRSHIWLDYTEFRAYFLAGVQPIDALDFGFCYDAIPLQHLGGFYDQKIDQNNFYDGWSTSQRAADGKLYGEIERVRAGGVSWDMYLEPNGCN